MILFGIGFGALFWLLDSFIDARIFHNDTIIKQIFSPDPAELFMRLFVAGLFILFGFYSSVSISKRKLTEEELQLNDSRMLVLLELNQMAPHASLQQIADFILEQGIILTKSAMGFIGFLDDGGKVFTMHGWSKETMKECSTIDKSIHLPIEEAGIWAEAVRQKHPIMINNYSAPNAKKKGYPEGHVPLHRILSVPLVKDERIICLVAVGNKSADYQESDINQLTLLLAGMWRQIEQKFSEESLHTVAEGVSGSTGDAFFRLLVEYLAKHLKTDYAFVGELTGENNKRVTTVAVFADGKVLENFEYALPDTPCENVSGKTLCVYPQGVQQQFPHDHMLRELGVESYIGIPLFDSSKHPLGLIVAMDRNPLKDPGMAQSVLTIFATRAAAELERIRMGKMITQAKEDWEDTFNTITDMITIHDENFNIIYSNRAAQELLGLPLLRVNEANCFHYCHGIESLQEDRPGREHCVTDKPTTFELFEPNLKKFIEIRAIPRFDHEGKMIGLIHIVRDISDQKHIQERMKKQLDRQRALRTIEMSISSSLDLRMTLEIFLDQVLSQLHVDAASVLLHDQSTQMLCYSAGKGFWTDRISKVNIGASQSFASNLLIKRDKVIIPDIMESQYPNPSGEEYNFSDTFFIKEEKIRAYMAVPLIAKGHVNGILEIFHRSPFRPDSEWIDFLETLAGQAALAIDNATLFENLQRSRDELITAYDTTIEGWSRALDYRDRETEGHSQRVAEITVKIARNMGMRESDLVYVRRGALLHDIGKIGMPDKLLFKKGDLDEAEWEVMKKHATIAYELLSPIEFLREALDIPYCHHEKWDGTGYPRELKGQQIPLAARIFAVADIWDALCSDRPYRKAWTKKEANEHIRSRSGTYFDPKVVEVFLRMDL
jgi:putative nucleotidyltransferase with HDIG domain/PAS domain S-box-containing protein